MGVWFRHAHRLDSLPDPSVIRYHSGSWRVLLTGFSQPGCIFERPMLKIALWT